MIRHSTRTEPDALPPLPPEGRAGEGCRGRHGTAAQMRDMGAAEAAQVGGDGGDGAGTSQSVENQRRGRVVPRGRKKMANGIRSGKCLTRSMGYRI